MSASAIQTPVIIGCDHAAYPLKEKVKAHLIKRAIDVEDVGRHTIAPLQGDCYRFGTEYDIAHRQNMAGSINDGTRTRTFDSQRAGRGVIVLDEGVDVYCGGNKLLKEFVEAVQWAPLLLGK